MTTKNWTAGLNVLGESEQFILYHYDNKCHLIDYQNITTLNIMSKRISLQSKCQRTRRISTWCQPCWDLHSDSARRSKSSCRCLLDDRLWWHESTGHTGDACRLCNVCREENQFCDTDNDKRGRQEWKNDGDKERERKKQTFPYLSIKENNSPLFYVFSCAAGVVVANLP